MNQVARKPGTQPDSIRGSYGRGGGEIALWVEVLIVALIDWARTERTCRIKSPKGKVYTYTRIDNGRKLPGGYFDSQDCREIVAMVGTAGIKAIRYYFTNKSQLSVEKRKLVAGIIDKLETYLK